MKHIRIASGALALLLATACVTPGVTAKAATAGQEAIMQQWVDEGLLTGYEDGTLRPDATVNRAQFVHLMVQLGFTGTGSTASYTDVESTAWYYSDIMSASAAGYVSGRANGSFGPRDTITRQEGIAMVARALNLTNDYVTGSGENCSDWFAGEVGAIIGAGLYGSGTDFTADLSRAETVALLEAVRNRNTTVNGGVSLAIGGEVTGDSTTATTATVVSGSDETITKKADKVSGTVANLTISSKLGSTAYTLDDVTVTGDLIIEATGSITLDDVTVKGKIIVEGSGANVILKKNADVGDVVFHDSGSISGSTYKGTLGTVTVDTDSQYDSVTLSVKADTVDVDDQCYLYIEKNVATLNVNSGAKNATIGIDYSAKVTKANVGAAVELYGRGDIGTLYLSASNCTISRGLDITKTSKASGVKGTTYTYNDYWYTSNAYKTYCTIHGYYDYCDWDYWYGNGWCPIHDKYDDGCWWEHGPNTIVPSEPGVKPDGTVPGEPGVKPDGTVPSEPGVKPDGTVPGEPGAAQPDGKPGDAPNAVPSTVTVKSATLSSGSTISADGGNVGFTVTTTGDITGKTIQLIASSTAPASSDTGATVTNGTATLSIAKNTGAEQTLNLYAKVDNGSWTKVGSVKQAAAKVSVTVEITASNVSYNSSALTGTSPYQVDCGSTLTINVSAGNNAKYTVTGGTYTGNTTYTSNQTLTFTVTSDLTITIADAAQAQS